MRRAMMLRMAAAFVAIGSLGYWAGVAHLLLPSAVVADSTCQTFTETGHMVCGDFLAYWQSHGGLAQQGFPISDVFNEKSETDGKTYQVQYFERAVFEAHPENAPPNNVLLSLLGSQKYKAKYPNGSLPAVAPPPSVAAPTSALPPATGPFRVGQRGAVGANAVTLWAVRDPAPTDNFSKPKTGNRIIAIDVTIENSGSKPEDYNEFQAFVKTADDRKYDTAGTLTTLTPPLTSGTNKPGEKVRGWIAFEIPSSAALTTFTYEDFEGNAVTFALR